MNDSYSRGSSNLLQNVFWLYSFGIRQNEIKLKYISENILRIEIRSKSVNLIVYLLISQAHKCHLF